MKKLFRGRSRLLIVLATVFSMIASTNALVAVADAHTSTIDLADFRLDLVADGLSQPTSMQFLPDGRMIVTDKATGLLILDPNGGVPTPFGTYTSIADVDSAGERGVLNVVLDPDFATNNWIYVFYTSTGGLNRVMRFTHQENSGGITSSASFASGVMIWQHSNVVTSCCHQGGGLTFGSDGKLYITVGEDFDPTQSQDLTNAGGKVHRVNKDGTVPGDNPFNDGAGPFVDTIWSYGLRNPFRATWDTIDDRLMVGIVGGNNHNLAWESVFAAPSGANFGWPACGEGPTGRESNGSCTDPSFQDPLFAYAHQGQQASVTGGFRYTGTEFPSELQGAYFFADFVNGWIHYLTFDGNGDVIDEHPFIETPTYDAGNIVDLKEGPDGALYYVQISGAFPVGTSVNACSGGCIRRVVYETGNHSPVITAATATPPTGPAPLAVQFDATATDTEGDPLQFDWDFGDGSFGSGANVNHTYTTNGSKTVVLSVSDGFSTSTAVLPVDVGLPPVINLTSPINLSTFQASDLVTFSATATDPDGPPPTDFSWTVSFRHNFHFHPVLGPVAQQSVDYTVPSSGHSYTDDTAYVATLVVTDADGLSSSQTVEVLPDKVYVTLATTPVDLDVELDGIPVAVNVPIDTLIGFQHTVTTADRCQDGRYYTFDNWSQGGTQTQTVIVPVSDVTWTANFTDSGPCTPPTADLSLRLIADQATSVAGEVTSWTDASGNGNTLTPLADGPTFVPFGLGDTLSLVSTASMTASGGLVSTRRQWGRETELL